MLRISIRSGWNVYLRLLMPIHDTPFSEVHVYEIFLQHVCNSGNFYVFILIGNSPTWYKSFKTMNNGWCLGWCLFIELGGKGCWHHYIVMRKDVIQEKTFYWKVRMITLLFMRTWINRFDLKDFQRTLESYYCLHWMYTLYLLLFLFQIVSLSDAKDCNPFQYHSLPVNPFLLPFTRISCEMFIWIVRLY